MCCLAMLDVAHIPPTVIKKASFGILTRSVWCNKSPLLHTKLLHVCHAHWCGNELFGRSKPKPDIQYHCASGKSVWDHDVGRRGDESCGTVDYYSPLRRHNFSFSGSAPPLTDVGSREGCTSDQMCPRRRHFRYTGRTEPCHSRSHEQPRKQGVWTKKLHRRCPDH